MAWRQFVMELGSLRPETIEDVLLAHGAVAVTYTDAADEPVLEPLPGETPLWSKTRITGLFAADADFDALRTALQDATGLRDLPPFAVDTLAERAWEREWLRDARPLRCGERLWICPGDTDPPAVDDTGDDSGDDFGDAPGDVRGEATIVRLDPGLAFGTGTHATTALCLEWLDGLDLAGKQVLDVGCGSGILGIAALLLGAARVVAIDIDPQALAATRRNAARNGVADALETTTDAGTVTARFDVVVANILAAPLLDMAHWICQRVAPRGKLAISGILGSQAAMLETAFADANPPIPLGQRVEREQAGQRWLRLSGCRSAEPDDNVVLTGPDVHAMP